MRLGFDTRIEVIYSPDWFSPFFACRRISPASCEFSGAPGTPLGWALLFIFALPAMLLFEAIGEAIFRNRFAQAVERKTAGKEFSWLRIMYGLLAFLLVVAVLLGIAKPAGAE